MVGANSHPTQTDLGREIPSFIEGPAATQTGFINSSEYPCAGRPLTAPLRGKPGVRNS